MAKPIVDLSALAPLRQYRELSSQAFGPRDGRHLLCLFWLDVFGPTEVCSPLSLEAADA